MASTSSRSMFAAAAFAWALVSGGAFATTPIPNGNWSFVFTDAKGQPDRPMRVYTYRPRLCDTKCPILFVMAGVKRDASVSMACGSTRMILREPSR